MKILVIGGNGAVGNKISSHFSKEHHVIIGGRTSGDVVVDIADSDSIKTMFESLGTVDAVISIAGEAKWGTFESLTEEDFYVGIKSKLMGQVNLVRIGKDYLTKKGSFTLTTGILADHPVLLTTSAAMVNGGIHSFVKAAALELPNNIRINAVSPGLVEDSVDRYSEFFPGHNPIPMNKVLNCYIRSVLGWENGEVISIYDRA